MTDTFFDKPINGDITRYTERAVDQHDPQELIEKLDALIALDGVEKVRWHQYTPYFNDGDPCVFGVYAPRVKLRGDEDEEFDYDEYRDDYSLYQYEDGETRYHTSNRKFEVNGIDTKPVYDAITELEGLFAHHENVLKEKFGDPAEVTYDGESFDVEYYDHE